jgi:hypothetical protein
MKDEYNDHNYDELRRVLKGAYDQAATGKGKERHATDEAFEDQKICVISRWISGSPVAGVLFQAIKKAIESSRLPKDRAIRELQGAINYLAAAIILLEEQEDEVWGVSIFEQLKKSSEKRQEQLREELNTNLFDTQPDQEEDRFCPDCKFHGTPVLTGRPCNKCYQYAFKPHYRKA